MLREECTGGRGELKEHSDADVGDAVFDVDGARAAGDGDDGDDGGGNGAFDGHVKEDGEDGYDDDAAAEAGDGADDSADERGGGNFGEPEE